MDSPVITDYLESHASKRPDMPAFITLNADTDIESTISFGMLSQLVRNVSAHLYAKGFAGERVMLLYNDVLAFIVSFLACQKAGVVPVPVPYARHQKDLQRLLPIMEDVQPAAILCRHYSVKQLGQWLAAENVSASQIVCTDDLPEAAASSLTSGRQHSDMAFIQYTSGSTSAPKGVMVSMKSLLHNQQLLSAVFGCTEQSVIFSWLPFHHDMGLIGNILHAVYTGCTCLLMSGHLVIQSPVRWLRAISRYRVTHSGGPNFAYDFCVDRIAAADAGTLDLSCWQVAYNGAEPVKANTMLRFADHFHPAGFRSASFFPCYGLAEATLLVAGGKAGEVPVPPVTFRVRQISAGIQQHVRLSEEQPEDSFPIVGCGTVPDGMEVIVLTDNGTVCAELEPGEICIAGTSVTSGYWRKDNMECFRQFGETNYFRTGDIGFFCGGQLCIFGRIKEVIIIRGRNYYPADIGETITASHPDIMANGVALFSLDANSPDAGDSSRYAVVVEIKRQAIRQLDGEGIVAAVEKTVMGNYGIELTDVVLTPPFAIPRTTSGKIQHSRCRRYYQERLFTTVYSKQPSEITVKHIRDGRLLKLALEEADVTAIKTYLLDMIRSKTGYEPDAEKDSALAEMGIDSLRLMEMVNMINREMGLSLEINMVLDSNTLTGFTEILRNLLWIKKTPVSGEQIII